MSETFLFQIDSATDNDPFFDALKPSISYWYRGTDMAVSPLNWKPDLVKIIVDESKNVRLTLIELDATESAVRISCRKYLPENSTDIVRTFSEYLDRVIRECHSRADPRKEEFVRLKEILLKTNKITVTTAGALRSSTSFLEERSLFDQPERIAQTQPVQEILQAAPKIEIQNFHGTLRLSADKSAALGRTIMILDAVIRQRDHGDSTMSGWRKSEKTQPLKKLLKKNPTAFPHLRSFISEKSFTGTTLDFEKLVPELFAIWSDADNIKIDQERVRSLISCYFPIAVGIGKDDRMPAIFDAARKFLADESKLA